MALSDKSTYTGQFASRRKFQKKMDNTNKHRLRALHLQLGSLLTTRKALNSKVTTRHFDLFREAVDADADPHEIKSRLNKLEQSLKQEGLYKNVKSDFVHLRKDILGSLNWTEKAALKHHTLPGISTVAKDRTFYVAPKPPPDEHAAASGVSSGPPKTSGGLSTDDMRMLNTAIGKLYRHLQLSQKEADVASSEVSSSYKETVKENVNVLTLSHMNPEETFHDIVLKLRNFEKEFQRQKVQQQREQMRLQEEIKRLNKNAVELRKDNERMKGVQPILTKAKGKQVGLIEERHRSEKKGMEDKIIELESGMRRNFAQLLNDKEEIRAHVRSDVESLMSSISGLHQQVHGHGYGQDSSSSTITMSSRAYADEHELLPTKEMLDMLNSVASGVQALKNKNQELSNKLEEMGPWRRSLKELDREINKFCRGYTDDDDDLDNLVANLDSDPVGIVSSCKSKLQKTKDNMTVKLKGIGDATSIIKRKERDVSKYRRSLKEVQGEIGRLHEQVISVQIQDISISMPEFERRSDPRSPEGSADELPEADRAEQSDLLEQIKQIGAMVTHFQQLIIDRTSIVNKMENDMLPLKIRVNRLHEEIQKSMATRGSPDHDPADDLLSSKRSFSPEGTTNVISREISNMLKKLSKMEMTIRHLLESYAQDRGRASI